MRRRQKQRIAKAALAGVVGGLAGAWTMNQYSAVSQKVQAAWKKSHPHQQDQQSSQQSSEEDDATMKTADRLSVMIAHRHLTKAQKQKAGPIVHYAYGALIGGLYGALSQLNTSITSGRGTAYASAVWLGGDEIGVPALGLAGSPAEYPISVHLNALASHLVYGATLDLVRRGVQSAL